MTRFSKLAIALTSVACAFSPAAAPRPASSPISARLILGPVKIRPYAALPQAAARPVPCARGGYCSFQVVLTATGEDLSGVDVSLSYLSLAEPHADVHTSISSDLSRIYREDFVNVFYRSSEQGDLGEWPDPLIPRENGEEEGERGEFHAGINRISPAYKRYRAEKGRSLAGGRGRGEAISGGSYGGGLAKRYVVELVKPGALGTATFRWWSDPGAAQPSAELPTATGGVPLDSGVSVAFRGDGREDDFLAGDEFWIFAGPQRHQPFWVDIFIPTSYPAGMYAGEVRVTARGLPPLRVPVQVELLDVELPPTTLLANSFLMNWNSVAAAHFPQPLADPQKEEERKIKMGKAYATLALRDGITLAPSEDLAPVYTFHPDGILAGADYSRFDEAVAGFMDGETPLGMRWTSLPLPRLKRLTAAQRGVALRDFIVHARKRGWYDRLYDYSYDEPSTPGDYAGLRARAGLVREIDPGIPRLVTTGLNPDLFGLVTRWCPVVNALDPKYSSPREQWLQPRRARRGEYDARLRLGESLWWYQSCSSHGCGGGGRSPQYDNWPSTMIDASAVANRVFGFLTAVTYRVSGVLYWDVAYAHAQTPVPGGRGLSPWESQYYFGGNGDGSLFYPGTPERTGGKRDIPIESLRLKMIRESFYDAEYALLLRQLGEEEFLNKETGRVVQKAWQWDADPLAWLDLRERLGRRIAMHAGAATRKRTP